MLVTAHREAGRYLVQVSCPSCDRKRSGTRIGVQSCGRNPRNRSASPSRNPEQPPKEPRPQAAPLAKRSGWHVRLPDALSRTNLGLNIPRFRRMISAGVSHTSTSHRAKQKCVSAEPLEYVVDPDIRMGTGGGRFKDSDRVYHGGGRPRRGFFILTSRYRKISSLHS